MSEHAVEIVNEAAEAHNDARQDMVEILNDPEAPRGSLSSAAAQVEATRAEFDVAVTEAEAEAQALEAGL